MSEKGINSKYVHGKIYRIVSDQTDRVYIGSTCYERLCKRMSKHRCDYGRYQRGIGGRCTSFDLLQFDDARIVLIEEWPCTSRDQLRSREQYWIEHYRGLGAALNKCNAIGRSVESFQKSRDRYRSGTKFRETRAAYLKTDKSRTQTAEYMREYRARTYACGCTDRQLQVCSRARHERSEKHKKWAETQV